MNIKNKAAICGAALAMTFGFGEQWPQGDEWTPQEVAITVEAFATIKQYWIAKSIGINSVKLVLLDEDESACGISGSDSLGKYCERDDKVIMTVGVIKTLERKQAGLRAATTFVVAHELGHAVQDAKNLLSGKTDEDEELQATCLAGTAMKDLYPALIPSQELTEEYYYYILGVQGVDCLALSS